jgi:hypothetical protein
MLRKVNAYLNLYASLVTSGLSGIVTQDGRIALTHDCRPKFLTILIKHRSICNTTPSITAIRARRTQKGQLPAGHTIPTCHSGRQASSRHPSCHRESAAASRLSELAGRQSTKRHRRRHCVHETFLSAVRIEVQLHLTNCRQYCDRADGACCLGSSQSMQTLRLSWP